MSNLQKRLEDKLDSVLVDMAQQKRKYTKVPDFRVSSLPVCPLRTFLFNDKTDSYSMDFYTSIGTAVHETAQKWLSVGNFQNEIFSCWKVKETGEILGPCFKNEIPKKYDNYTIEYEEITIQYNGLSGHVDLVLEMFPGQYMVVDFKTTDLSSKKRLPSWQKFYPASRSSIIQISTYSTLLRKLFKLNIVGWCLVYVDRGKVITKPDDYHKVMRPWTKQKHRAMLEKLDRACENDALFRRFHRIMQKSEDFNPKAVKLLKKMVVNRPCVDEESYNGWIDYKFWKGFSKNPEQGVINGQCALKKHCLSGSKACYNAVLRQLENDSGG